MKRLHQLRALLGARIVFVDGPRLEFLAVLW